MKLQELRIGNLVKANGKIETITGVIQYGVYFSGGYCPNIGDLIQPIELTEDWLIKFEFEEITWYYQKITDADSTEFKLSFDGDFKLWFLAQLHFSDAGIKYVHQLQNLYHSLTGEELTIKNNEQ